MTVDARAHGDALSETELVLRARDGDPSAWEDLVGRHREAVFRYAYLQLGDSADAEDTTQDTFVRAFRSFHRFDGTRPLRPWLLRIARNLARNRWRAWLRRGRATDRWGHEETVRATAAIDGETMQAAEELRGVVSTMRDEDRQVIYLRYFLHLSLEETGAALDVPLGTVKSRLSRALERLRELVLREHPHLRQALEE